MAKKKPSQASKKTASQLVRERERKIGAYAPAYSGSSQGRRGKNWVASGSGPAFVTQSLDQLRRRARDLVRNDPWVAKASRVYTSNLIGKGIRPVAKTHDAGFNADIMELWNLWNQEADASGTTSFYGMQALITKSLYCSGEALARKILNADEDSLLPLQIQLLEPDFLDHTFNQIQTTSQPLIVQGVEMGRYKPAAFHLFKSHPGEALIGLNKAERIRVPSDEMLHIRLTDRIGQMRGITPIAASLLRVMDVLEYEEAELTRKKVAAMFVAFVRTLSDDADALQILLGSEKNEQGQEEATIEPGVLQHLKTGQDIVFNQPADVGGTYEPFMRQQQRAMAAPSDVTYEEMTGDMSGTNFSSARVGLNTVRRIHEQTQEHVLKPQFCRPSWIWFVKNALASGEMKAPSDYLDNPRRYLKAEFVSPAWYAIQPKEEEEAAQMAIRGGTDTRENVNARKGLDIIETDKQNKIDQDRADSMGLVYDTDPRVVSKAGNSANPTKPNPEKPEGE